MFPLTKLVFSHLMQPYDRDKALFNEFCKYAKGRHNIVLSSHNNIFIKFRGSFHGYINKYLASDHCCGLKKKKGREMVLSVEKSQVLLTHPITLTSSPYRLYGSLIASPDLT